MNALVKALLLTVVSLSSLSGQASLFELRGEIFAEEVSSECVEWPEPIFCFGEIQAVGDRSTLRFFVDLASRIPNPEAIQGIAAGYFSYLPGSDDGHFFGHGAAMGAEGEFWIRNPAANIEPFAIGHDFVHVRLTLGDVHGFSIYAYSHDDLAGEQSVGLSDSSGTAFAGADLSFNGGVDDWLLNHFDIAMFDSGSWWATTFDGGGGGSGRFLFPESSPVAVLEPSSLALLGIGLFLGGMTHRRRRRATAS